MRIQEGGDPVGPGADPVTAVIARMEQVSTALPPRDGVRAFDQMYLETTRQVDAAIRGQQFADPVFMARLDVVFAGLFLGVWDRYATGPAAAAQVPRCWRALFDVRSRTDVAPLQFAVAGMNAHINHDLSLALVQTCEELGGGLDASRRTDFLAINRVLAQTQPAVRQELLRGPWAVLDHALGGYDDRIALWGIEQAREFAWSTAETLLAVRGTRLEETFEGGLDRMVALSSRLLLFGPGSRAAPVDAAVPPRSP